MTANSLLFSNAHRGMLDFVRRRKLHKVAYFRPDHFLPRDVHSKCDFCDSKAVDLISVSGGVYLICGLLLCSLLATNILTGLIFKIYASPLANNA